MLENMLKEYNLPEIPSVEECKRLLQEYEYGYLPEKPEEFKFETLETNLRSCGGRAVETLVRLYGKLKGEDFSFPIKVTLPKHDEGQPAEKRPLFVQINFRPDVPDIYQPTEEIFDNGFAIASFCYKDVTSDNNDFSNGLAKTIYPDGVKKDGNGTGKIMMWAWAAMRTLDYMEIDHKDEIDFDNVAVCGHSRLGKTALVTGAFDDRFKFVFSNDSGCGGAAIERNHHDKIPGKQGFTAETIEVITKVFPFWFCENYKQYAGKPETMPHDQHFLGACVYPRHLYIASAELDYWADQTNEFMCAYAVSKYYEENGKTGLVTQDRLPETDENLHDGTIGYHRRTGAHYFSRQDWIRYMAFIKKHM